ncbi:MAG: tetratricopeptide repeat protein [Rhodospirillales bacterium]|nr:tetratricopeptide repeat protein [Rhodospirillales bacterium]
MGEWITLNADLLSGLAALTALASFLVVAISRAKIGLVDRVLSRSTAPSAAGAPATGAIDIPPDPEKARASIGVMPFDSLSADESDAYLAAGIAGDVLSALTSASQLNVAPRADSFALKGQNLEVSEIARRLSVRYVVTGCVRRAGSKLRVSAEFADTRNGRQLWAKTYDRELTDVFEVQEDIARSIAGAVGGEAFRAEILNLATTDNLDAWSLTQKARHDYMVANNPQAIKDAVQLVRQAIDVDPGYALAHATYGMLLMDLVSTAAAEDKEQSKTYARVAIERALELSDNQPDVLMYAGRVWVELGEREKSISVLRRAAQISPYDLMNWGFLARSLAFGTPDNVEEALAILGRIRTLAPEHPCVWTWDLFTGIACMNQEHYEDAAANLEKALEASPNFVRARLLLANALGALEQSEKAKVQVERAVQINASFVPARYAEYVTAMARDADVSDRLIGSLRKAGLLNT